jgi:hypothetical protein
MSFTIPRVVAATTTSVAVCISLMLSAVAAPIAAAKSTLRVDCTSDPAALAPAIVAASAGATLLITGTCEGRFVIDKDLTLKGTGQAALDSPREDPIDFDFTRLRITEDAVVSVIDLGLFATPRQHGAWPAIVNDGTLTLRGSSVSGPVDNRGTLTVVDSAIQATSTGGVLNNEGTLTLRHSSVRAGFNGESSGAITNTATGTAIVVDSAVSGNVYFGPGAIGNFGTMTLINSVISDSSTFSGPGGIQNGGTMTLLRSVVENTTQGVEAPGAGIANTGTLVLRDSVIKGNTWSRLEYCGGCDGAGVYNNGGTVQLYDSVVQDNVALGDGGGIYNASGTVRLYNSVVQDNVALGDGGGINNAAEAVLRLSEVSIAGNNAGLDGGGVFNEGTVVLVKVKFSRNTPNDCTGCP